ncbi:unnamed protein product, partial [marine sediment metagenome]
MRVHVQEGPREQHGRETPLILCVTAVNFSHKVLCAAVFGGFGLLERSVPQLGFLMALQVRPCACMCVQACAWKHLHAYSVVYPRSVGASAKLTMLHARTQGAMLVYLAAVRPFREALLQAVELTCHALEAGLFACALALVNAQPNNGAATTYVMVGELQALKAAGARVLSPASGFIPMPRSHARAPHYATYGSDLRPRSAFVAFLRTS